MKEEIVLHGVVLSEHSLREFDKRLQLLTMERGKMTVWASGAKRPNSPLLAGSRSFVFGKFHLREGKAGYTLRSVEVDAYFEEIAKDLEKACYAAYFLELAELVAQENLEAPQMVELLYLSLKALLHKGLKNELVRRIFELRMLMLEGSCLQTILLKGRKFLERGWRVCGWITWVQTIWRRVLLCMLEENSTGKGCSPVERGLVNEFLGVM